MPRGLVEKRKRLDVRHLRRERVLEDGQPELAGLRIEWLPKNYGGFEPVFVCPVCSERKVHLYRRDDGGFACRTCEGLVYRRQRMAPPLRDAARADKIRAQLGWKPGILNGPGLKPRGMQWETYARALEEYVSVAESVLQSMRPRAKK